MKSRILYIFLSSSIALAAVVLGMMLLSGIAGRGDVLSRPSTNETFTEDGGGVTVLARRIISIPFGIDDVLGLSPDGQIVQVSGHGDCVEGAESYKLSMSVTQGSNNAPAKGRTEGACPSGSSIRWSTEAVTPRPHTLAPGNALVCGHAVIHTNKEGAVTFDWCKTVTLE